MSRRLFHQLFSRGLASDREGREIGAASLAYPIQVAAFDSMQDAVREASATLQHGIARVVNALKDHVKRKEVPD